jgi:hypothetical protein
MHRDLARRIERLERARDNHFAERLSALARKFGAEPATFLRITQGHEAELDPELSKGGFITWEGFLRLYNLIRASRGQRPVSSRHL